MSVTKAFVSYSWDSDQHKEWVAKLATDLRHDGIETILDQWHTELGDQLTEFMERQIRENDYVLIVCTPNYRLKSDERKGGVGYEGDIMTAEVHNQRNHRKFIPILAQGSWEEAAPSWLKGKYYVDLSSADKYKENYPDLVTTVRRERRMAPPLRRPLQPSTEYSIQSSVTAAEWGINSCQFSRAGALTGAAITRKFSASQLVRMRKRSWPDRS